MNMKNFFNNEAGVSPIVATLVLVVVAIAGAAAVGTIMGSFSSDVSDSASAEGASQSASTELLIAGSSTVQPVSEILAESYMDAHPGVKVTVQGGGSGAGVSSTELDIVDIGASSSDVDTVNEHPDLVKHVIGGSAIVIIGNDVTGNATKDEITAIYNNVTSDGTIPATTISTITSGNLTVAGGITDVSVFQRSDASGTEETFSKYFGAGDKHWADSTDAKGEDGNALVLKAVEDTKGSMGFVDFGFAAGSDAVELISVEGHSTDKDDCEDEVIAALKSESSAFDEGMTRPLIYLTNGAPSSLEQSFIDFAMQPANTDAFEDVGYFPMIDLV
ncbi:substrate-binding domain-containing protein [Methanolobus sp. ZRKC2]|uniref:PstS family phosphate ABC transporter substrate-binding protein n=1 Tax=Methanolobus sp. ZRKC2 TaxID=3125783 RepID=UPI003248C9A8